MAVAHAREPPREVNGNVMTHCVPNERVAIAADEDLVGASGPWKDWTR